MMALTALILMLLGITPTMRLLTTTLWNGEQGLMITILKQPRPSPLRYAVCNKARAYDVRVKAVNEINVSSAYLTGSQTPATDTTAPSAPSSVSASGEFEQITINWTNPTVDDFSHVDVYRSTSSSGTYTLIGKSAGTNFTDTNLAVGVTRYYKLRSVDYSGNATKDGSGNPVYSSIVNATTTQVPVGGIADDAVDTDQIADLAVETDQIDDDAVTIAKVAASLQSTNYVSGSAGWKIQKSGVVEFEEATIRGEIVANTGEIGGFDIANTYLKDAANTMGLSSVASSADDVRFWAGNTFANRASAPFFVTKSGALKATEVTVSGTAPQISIGTNSSDTITLSTASDYRLWVGSSTPESAKFKIHKDGTLTAKGMHLQDGSASAYFGADGFTDLAYSQIATNTQSRVNVFETSNNYNLTGTGLNALKVNLTTSSSLTITVKASNLFSGLSTGSVTGGSAASVADAIADIPDNFTLALQKSTTSGTSGFSDLVTQTFTKVTSGSASSTTYLVESTAYVPPGTTNFATQAEVNITNYASVSNLNADGNRVLENTSTYATGAVYFRVLLSTTDTSYDSTLNNIMNNWPRVLSIKDNGATGFTVVNDDPNNREITQAAGTGGISGVTAGTNLNGGGTSGTVTLNLDSTISGNHTFSDNLIIGGNLLVGKTGLDTAVAGTEIRPNLTVITSAGDTPLYLRRNTNDGELINFRKDGTTVGSIGVAAGDNIYFAGGSGSTKGIYINNAAVYPANTGGDVIDNAVALGQSGVRWTDLYLSGGVSTNTATGLSITADSSNRGILNLSTSTAYQLIGGSYYGYTGYKTGGYHRWFGSDGSEDMRLSGGNLLVGKTAPTISTTGVELRPNGQVFATQSGNYPLLLNRTTSDGDIIQLRKDGTTVGSIGTANNDLVIGTADTNLWFDDGANAFNPASSMTLGASNGVIDLGTSGRRFKDLYLSGVANVTGISSSGNVTIGSSSLSANAALKFQADTGTFILEHERNSHSLNLSDPDGTGRILRIDTSGNLMLGTTSSSPTSGSGFSVQSIGRIFSSVNGGYVASLNRGTSDGEILRFRKDGPTVGSIGTYGNGLLIGTTEGSDAFLKFESNAIRPATSTGGYRDAAIDLGHTSSRFKDLYLSGAISSGAITSTSSMNAAGGYYVSGTEVINASKEIKNVPRIFFNGGLQAVDLNNSDSLIFDTPDGHSALLLSGGTSDTNYHSNTTHFFRGTDLLDFHAQIDTDGISSFGDYKVGSTTVIDASRNLTNIGTASFSNTVTMSGSGTVNITKGLGLYVSNNVSVGGLIYNTTGSDVVIYGDTSISSGDLDVSGALSKGSGSFKIDHPLPEKRETHCLVHSFVEAPQADNIYRGKVTLVDGSATVNIDTVAGMSEGTYVLLNTNTQCFTSNESGWTAVKGLVSGNILTIEAKEPCSDTISWMVVGERHDQHMIDTKWTDENGKVIVEPEKTLDANNDKINKLKSQLSKRT